MRVIIPKSILFDFDGIVIDTIPIPNWEEELAEELNKRLALTQLDTNITIETLSIDLLNTVRAVSFWTNSTSMERKPKELPDHMWLEYLTVNWNAQARQRASDHLESIIYLIVKKRHSRTIRPGIIEVFKFLQSFQIPMAVVSNTACGDVVKEFLLKHELAQFFSYEVYSNEVGVRKPNPEIIHYTAKLLGLEPNHIWFIGDRLDRDVACAHRARVAKSILMDSLDTAEYPYELNFKPDVHVKNPHELLKHIQNVFLESAKIA